MQNPFSVEAVKANPGLDNDLASRETRRAFLFSTCKQCYGAISVDLRRHLHTLAAKSSRPDSCVSFEDVVDLVLYGLAGLPKRLQKDVETFIATVHRCEATCLWPCDKGRNLTPTSHETSVERSHLTRSP